MSILGCGKLKVLLKMYWFTVNRGGQTKLKVAEDRSDFLSSDRKFFFLSYCVCLIDYQKYLWE